MSTVFLLFNAYRSQRIIQSNSGYRITFIRNSRDHVPAGEWHQSYQLRVEIAISAYPAVDLKNPHLHTVWLILSPARH